MSTDYDEIVRSIPDDVANGKQKKIAALPTNLSAHDEAFFRGIAEINVSFDSLNADQVAMLEESHCNLTVHQKRVIAWERQFFGILATDPKTAVLSRISPATGDREFYRYFANSYENYKQVALNNIMKLYVLKTLERTDGKMYQPGTLMTRVKSLFGLFHTRGIHFSATKDFNFNGGFGTMLKGLWKKENRKDIKFGCRPNRVVLPKNYGQLIRKAVFDGLIDASGDDPYALLLLFACVLGTMLGLRGESVSDSNSFFVIRFFAEMTHI